MFFFSTFYCAVDALWHTLPSIYIKLFVGVYVLTSPRSAARKTIQTFNLGFCCMRNPNMIVISQQNEYFAIYHVHIFTRCDCADHDQ